MTQRSRLLIKAPMIAIVIKNTCRRQIKFKNVITLKETVKEEIK